MSLTLDPQSEQRVQREIALGHFREPADVFAHALDLLEEEQEWLLANRDALNERLTESMAQIARGEGIPGDNLLQVLAERRSC